jgi:TM2 domain-containing membrane protein YozV
MKVKLSNAFIVIDVILLISGLIRYVLGKCGRSAWLINLLVTILGVIILITGAISLLIG